MVVAVVGAAVVAAAARVPSATVVVRLGISRATARMPTVAVAGAVGTVAGAATVEVVGVATAASAVEEKLATPVGVLDTFLGIVSKAASATTAAGR